MSYEEEDTYTLTQRSGGKGLVLKPVSFVCPNFCAPLSFSRACARARPFALALSISRSLAPLLVTFGVPGQYEIPGPAEPTNSTSFLPLRQASKQADETTPQKKDTPSQSFSDAAVPYVPLWLCVRACEDAAHEVIHSSYAKDLEAGGR